MYCNGSKAVGTTAILKLGLLGAFGIPILMGCSSGEGLEIYDLHGTVVLPREAVSTSLEIGDVVKELVDVRLAGPVYLGLYPQIRYDLDTRPVPDVGIAGGAYPYGGTSIGDLRFTCVESLNCKLISGRYVDFDAIVDWFNNTLETPITDAAGAIISDGEVLRAICYDLLEVSEDLEVRLTASEDRNDDGTIDEADLQFVENADGDFEAPFIIYQQEMAPGFQLWGWMDSPSGQRFSFETCNEGNGLSYNPNEYNVDYNTGIAFDYVLNEPASFMNDLGDWIASEPYEWNDAQAEPVLRLDFHDGVDDVNLLRGGDE